MLFGIKLRPKSRKLSRRVFFLSLMIPSVEVYISKSLFVSGSPGWMVIASRIPSAALNKDVVKKYENVRRAIFPFAFMSRLAEPVYTTTHMASVSLSFG